MGAGVSLEGRGSFLEASGISVGVAGGGGEGGRAVAGSGGRGRTGSRSGAAHDVAFAPQAGRRKNEGDAGEGGNVSSDGSLGFTGSSERGAVRGKFAVRAELCASGALKALEPRGLLDGGDAESLERGAGGRASPSAGSRCRGSAGAFSGAEGVGRRSGGEEATPDVGSAPGGKHGRDSEARRPVRMASANRDGVPCH